MKITLWLLFSILAVDAAALCGPADRLVNFAHLIHLTERIALDDDSVDIVHIYANYPGYNWTGAAESGEEGIACVDDAARAALLYLDYFDLTRDTTALQRAVPLIRFVRHMEAEDGLYFNFLHADHSINREGRTSFKSFGWWAVRGLWCLAAGYRVFRDRDPLFAEELKEGVERSFPYIDSLFQRYGKYKSVEGFRVPQWLLYESGADVTSALMLGLSEYYGVTRDPKVRSYIRRMADGIIAMQDGNLSKSPFGVHRSWETMWHMWGNDQTGALAASGKLLQNRRMVASAEREARGFYSRLLIDGFRKEFDLASDSMTHEFEQIAYGVRPMVSGLLRLYEATRKTEYEVMAGLAASWFFGNNVAGEVMYDRESGRCYDGIRDSSTINRNSGAESTIEALWSLVEVSRYPRALRYLDAKKIHEGEKGPLHFAVFRTPAGNEVTIAIDAGNGILEVLEGTQSSRFRMRNELP